MNEPLDDSADRRADRIEARRRELGTRTPRCAAPGCREAHPEAFTGVAPNLLCREDLADAQDRSWTEGHHIAGRRNHQLVVDIPANDHAILSASQQVEWPRATLRNPDGSPLLRAAALLRGWLDILRLLIERGLGWIPPFLEALDEQLTAHIGPKWWETFGFETTGA
jgi:hypothetical protein